MDRGGWIGGQAEYVMVPYADFDLMKFPDKAQAMEKILDLTCLTDILPTGYHGCVNAGVITGSTALVSGAGPARSCNLVLLSPRTVPTTLQRCLRYS
jgi:glutathione-independent formaldehyde dehydrogenase